METSNRLNEKIVENKHQMEIDVNKNIQTRTQGFSDNYVKRSTCHDSNTNTITNIRYENSDTVINCKYTVPSPSHLQLIV